MTGKVYMILEMSGTKHFFKKKDLISQGFEVADIEIDVLWYNKIKSQRLAPVENLYD